MPMCSPSSTHSSRTASYSYAATYCGGHVSPRSEGELRAERGRLVCCAECSLPSARHLAGWLLAVASLRSEASSLFPAPPAHLALVGDSSQPAFGRALLRTRPRVAALPRLLEAQ